MSDLAFMFSNWYSGATLFAILLNNSRHLVCNGETFEFEHGDIGKDSYKCSCGQALPDCPFFGAAAARFWTTDPATQDLFSVLPDVASTKLSTRILTSYSRLPKMRDLYIRLNRPLNKRLANYLELHSEFYERARSMEHAACYVDGTKSVRRAELFHLYRNAPFSVLHFVRDGRGFAWSYLRNTGQDKSRLQVAADAWLSYLRQVDTFAARYPSIPVRAVRYEDLCHDLTGTLKGVSNFLGVEFDPGMVGAPEDFHVLGNQIRHTFDGTVRESLAWQREFSAEQLRELERLMAPELERFGYL